MLFVCLKNVLEGIGEGKLQSFIYQYPVQSSEVCRYRCLKWGGMIEQFRLYHNVQWNPSTKDFHSQ
jgi:hypothetical protein